MAEHNNHLAGRLPARPHGLLRTLQPLVGTWKISGPEVDGMTRWAWMEGGFFLIQRFDVQHEGRQQGVEYIGFDEETATLRSRLMQSNGARFTCTYEIDGDTWHCWFGNKGSRTHARAVFSADGRSMRGRWHWVEPDGSPGGYEFIATRIDEDTAEATPAGATAASRP